MIRLIPFFIGLILIASRPALAEDFFNVTYHSCYDGDTCRVTLDGMPDVFGDHIPIRLKGIDTPEMKGKCAREKQLAKQARDLD